MNCPKCSAPIKWYDLSPNCKKCGVHIMYYTQEEDLARDAKRTELEFANARILVAKLKSNFIGGKYPITRLVFLFLCVGALCIPFGNISAVLPFRTINVSVGGIGIYSMINDGLFPHIFDFLKAGIAEAVSMKVFISLILFALTVLIIAVVLVTYLLSFINIKKFAKIICGMTACAMITDIICTVWTFVTAASANNYDFITAKAGFGGFAALVIFGIFFYLNFYIYKKDEPLSIKEVDIKRAAIHKDIKAGKVDIDSLPMPIFETEEERIARENALVGVKKEKKKKNKKSKGEKTDE